MEFKEEILLEDSDFPGTEDDGLDPEVVKKVTEKEGEESPDGVDDDDGGDDIDGI